ncbi:hypothetical protein [Bariatricus sp. HCP28S3_D3]|uniref:hypothetical protein n=1 Tax=Bariatricus sp. HCP28S3_D3 TaxID=3438901 RepID=UPI003F8C332A
MRKKRRIVTLVLTLLLTCSMSAQAGFTPRYDVDMPEIPDIHVELSDEMKEAVNQAAQKQIEKMILDKPVVWHAECRTHTNYSFCTITWCKVEGATSYKVEITKPDGTKETYNAKGNWLYANSRYNKFIEEGMNGATVRVRAFGEDETYSLWSDKVDVSCSEERR